MKPLLRQELGELKNFFVANGWEDGLFQVLFVLENVKPGMYLQQTNQRKLRQFNNMLLWFNLHISLRHGGYATKNIGLFKEWNKFFGFKIDAERFLGYPPCCVRSHNSHLGDILSVIQLYSLVKAIRLKKSNILQLKQFILNRRFLHHNPCSINCEMSVILERKFEAVINKYNWLVADLLPAFYNLGIQCILSLLEGLQERLANLNINLINDNILDMGINRNDVEEILQNNVEFQNNLRFAKQFLESVI